ncbi:alpha/beta hydrolase [Actinosynnema pretiosum]|uniref:Alpha/beta-hydrolase fold protein n=2 Tax=Actinosynnema pretiosum TaxID=42197 RepID=A0A4Y6A9E6_9PSEU|nr:alpha/beta hydrolase [Actinosynnema pretiosum]ATE54237.1 transporter [Actinosynnema pretiosum]QDE53703.1 alpha/beta-hydrolase fold protein [Actinosynnema pretiosum subsp. pretiosum]
MRRISRALGAVVVCGALVTGVVTGVAGAQVEQRGDAGYRADIAWGPCGEMPSVECGTVRMPVDWGKPRGEKFDLVLARRKATDPAARKGVLFVNPGGPGGSGVDFVMAADAYFSAELLAKFDVIGVDPRGVARSNPVVCSAEKVAQQPSNYPADQAEFEALRRYNRELAADCRERTGPLFDHVDTLSGVEDMDAVRRSLGERELSYYGISYGTLLGQQYAQRHGDRVRAMVIDSNMDHDQGTWEFGTREAVGAEDSFVEFVAWCGRDESCALHGRDVPALWKQLLDRAERGELTHPNAPGLVLDRAFLRSLVLGALYGPSWSAIADFLVALEAQGGSAVAGAGAPEPELVENPFEVFCQDWNLPLRDHREFARLRARSLELAPNMEGSTLGEGAIAACQGRADAVDNPQRPWRVAPGTPKVLMLNALHDPSTPYSWAVGAHRQGRGAAVLLTYEGWGHGVYGRGACADGHTDRYLVDLEVPREGTRCAGVEPPAAAGSRASVPGGVGVERPTWG